MWTGFVIMTNKNERITEKTVNERLDRYTTLFTVPEYLYTKTEEFQEMFERDKWFIDQYKEHLSNYLSDTSDDSQIYVDYYKKRVEAIENNDLGKWIEAYGDGDYRVDGDDVYCVKNYKDGLFDFVELDKYFTLLTKEGKEVRRCKVSDWSQKLDTNDYPLMVYDWSNNTWYGKIFPDSDEEKEWEENFAQLIEKISNEDTIVYSVSCHF